MEEDSQETSENTGALISMMSDLMSNSFSQLTPEQVQQMVTQMTEIAGKSIHSGIKEGIDYIANRLLKERATVIPFDRQVDTILIYDAFGVLNNSEKCGTQQPFRADLLEFMKEYSKQRGFTYPKQRDNFRSGVAIRFDEQPISERDATSILGSEGLWLLYNNRRVVVYDGNVAMNKVAIQRFNESEHAENSFGVALITNLTRYKDRWTVGTDSQGTRFSSDRFDLNLEYTPLSSEKKDK